MAMSDRRQYWYNVKTHRVEEGAQSDWTQLLGPYTTREEAESALAKVQANNERWDEEEAADADWGRRPETE